MNVRILILWVVLAGITGCENRYGDSPARRDLATPEPPPPAERSDRALRDLREKTNFPL